MEALEATLKGKYLQGRNVVKLRKIEFGDLDEYGSINSL